MALLIPKSVGGTADITTQAVIEPIETRVSRLIIPASVGGDVQVAPKIQQEPIQQAAQPLSEIIPKAAQAATEAIQQTQPPQTGITDIFTGSERIAATPELGILI